MNSNYNKGRKFEYRVKRKLEGMGYFVIRQPKSAFPDLIAIKRNEVLAVECKYNNRLSSYELFKLLELKRAYGMTPVLAHKNKREREIKLRRLSENMEKDHSLS